jgi:glycosyltransferase involved in cell wall biosynthesis
MNILHLNQSDLNGGAALAAHRLHSALRENDIISRMIVGAKVGDDTDIKTGVPPTLAERTVFKLANQIFPANVVVPWGGKLANDPWLREADVVHVHNLHTGLLLSFLSLPRIARQKPMVITLHDMWHFTGHCSYSYDCSRWENGCGRCPHPDTYPAISWDSTWIEWHMKRLIQSKIHAHVISPSKWLAKLARKSLLGDGEVHVVPYPLDLNQFKPVQISEARQQLGWPKDKRIVLVAAADLDDERKGFPQIKTSIASLSAELKTSMVLALMGRGVAPKDLLCEVLALGYVTSEDTKALIYSASDYLAFASISDNLPLVVMEALACGLPVIAFAVGGVTDMVVNGQNGWLASVESSEEFSQILRDALGMTTLPSMRLAARSTAEKLFSPGSIVRRHRSIYEQAISGQTYGN